MLIQLVAPRIGVDPDRLRPIDAIGNISEPLLLIAGTDDHYTRLNESRALFDRARSPKEIWEVPGAGHEDIHEYSPLEYERRVGGFFVAHLRGPAVTTHEAAAATQDLQTGCRSETGERRDCR
jgi:fermentation-respiration switch protein FrsA (DUF1100 family)